jgi:undecaprenyl-diphosphatase
MTDNTNQVGAYRPAECGQRPARGWRIDPRHALAAALVCWAGFAVIVVLIETGHSAAFDDAGLRIWRDRTNLAQPDGPSWLLEAVRDYTALGGTLLRNLAALGGALALYFLRLRREAILFLLTIGSGWMVEYGLKVLVGRPRPTIVPHLMEAGGNSFPSGHSFNAAVVYIAMALAFAAISPRPAARWTLVASAMVLTLCVALSRVWLGVHYPTDAIAGWLGGAGWAFVASALLYRPAKAVASQADTCNCNASGNPQKEADDETPMAGRPDLPVEAGKNTRRIVGGKKTARRHVC